MLAATAPSSAQVVRLSVSLFDGRGRFKSRVSGLEALYANVQLDKASPKAASNP